MNARNDEVVIFKFIEAMLVQASKEERQRASAEFLEFIAAWWSIAERLYDEEQAMREEYENEEKSDSVTSSLASL